MRDQFEQFDRHRQQLSGRSPAAGPGQANRLCARYRRAGQGFLKNERAARGSRRPEKYPGGAPKEAEYTVRGYLVAAADAKGTKFSYIWDITDKGGKRAKRIQGDELIEGKKGGDPWGLVDEAVMQRVAAKTADDLIAWMPAGGAPSTTASTTDTAAQPVAQATEPPPQQRASRSQEPPATNVLAAQQPAATPDTQPAAHGPALAMVPPVTGAPGDGEASLTAAMRRHLEQAGVKLIEGSDPNAYTSAVRFRSAIPMEASSR